MATNRIKPGYGIIHREIMKSTLSQNAKNVYCLFVSYSGHVGVCYPSMSTIEKDLMMGRKTIVTAINELVLNDLLDVEQNFDDNGAQKSNNYYPKMPVGDDPFIAIKGGRSNSRGGQKTGETPVKKPSPGDVKDTTPPPVKQQANRIPVIDEQLKINNEKIDRSTKVEQSDLFPDDSKDQKKKSKTAGAAAEKVKTNYQFMMDIYYDWYKEQTGGIPPKIDGADGKALKQLIAYYMKIGRDRHPGESMEVIEKHCQDAFKYTLINWHKLDAFLQKQTKLTQINSNINNIINILKNGNKQTASEQKRDRAAVLNEAFNMAAEHYRNEKFT